MTNVSLRKEGFGGETGKRSSGGWFSGVLGAILEVNIMLNINVFDGFHKIHQNRPSTGRQKGSVFKVVGSKYVLFS